MAHHTRKALFLDIDGTLLDDNIRISDANRSAIADALDDGHLVVLSSGRPLESTRMQAEQLGLSGDGCFLIAYNGGVLYDCGSEKTLFSGTVPLPVVRGVFAEANRRGRYIQTYESGRVVIESHNDGEEIRAYCARAKMDYVCVDDIGALSEAPNKLLAADYRDHDALASFGAWINEHYAGILDCFFSADPLLEIVPCGLDKGRALLMLAELLSIPVADTVAVGDEVNDIPMIRAAGLGAAMANAVPAAKEAADYVTACDNNHSGVAEVIRKFILQ